MQSGGIHLWWPNAELKRWPPVWIAASVASYPAPSVCRLSWDAATTGSMEQLVIDDCHCKCGSLILIIFLYLAKDCTFVAMCFVLDLPKSMLGEGEIKQILCVLYIRGWITFRKLGTLVSTNRCRFHCVLLHVISFSFLFWCNPWKIF